MTGAGVTESKSRKLVENDCNLTACSTQFGGTGYSHAFRDYVNRSEN